MKERFIVKDIKDEKLAMISMANKIIRDYQAQGYTLTLRQLYYQFVARDLLPNTLKSYNRLGDAISDGRMLGMIDWEAIEDRTRGVEKNLRIASPKDAIKIVRAQYGIDMWANQPARVEVWIEKEALVGVIENVCRENDVPYLACRGYVSQSEQWRAFKRLQASQEAGQRTIILHFGDHDPSGIDMTRDNRERLSHFMLIAQGRNASKDEREAILEAGPQGLEVRRLALNMEQIEEYQPPANPAKQTDSRFENYAITYGDESWELDALEPAVISQLIADEIEQIRDPDLWAEKEKQLAEEGAVLDKIIAKL